MTTSRVPRATRRSIPAALISTTLALGLAACGDGGAASGGAGSSTDSEPDSRVGATTAMPAGGLDPSVLFKVPARADGPEDFADPTEATDPAGTALVPGSPLATFVEASRSQIEDSLDRFSDVYSSATLDGEGDRTLVLRYTFAREIDPASGRKQIESTREILETTATSSLFPEMKSVGIPDPAVKWIYLNPDGTEIITIYVQE